MMRVILPIYSLIITLLTLFVASVTAQSTANDRYSRRNIDSIALSVVRSDDSDSIKIDKLIRAVSDNRYAKYTKRTINNIGEIAKRSRDEVLIANYYHNLGNYYYYNSQLDTSEYYLLKSKEAISEMKLPFIRAAIGSSLGGVYRKKGNITLAISCVLESQAILESIDTVALSKQILRRLLSEQLIVYNTLANFYNQMGDFTQAEANYDRAYENALLLNSTKYAGVILSNKGDLLLNNNKYEEALNVLAKAKKLKYEGKAQESSIANTNQNIAVALYKTGEYDLALKSVNEALEYFKKSNATSRLMETYTIRGRIYFMKKDYQRAIDDCSISKRLAVENGILEMQEKACKCLSDAYEKSGDYKKSLLNYKLYQNSKDSVFNERNIKKITQMEMQYAYEKENELREIKTLAHEKENRATIRTLIIGIVSLLLILGLLYYLFYMRQKANEILKVKNKKISETLAINKALFKEAHHRIKNNLQIISSLLGMQSRLLDDSKSKGIVLDSQNRIKSMSLIHKKLYQENNITGVESENYFTDLIDGLVHSYGIDTNEVKVDVRIEKLLLDVDTAIPLGLILNEMVSNAFKYGVSKENGALSVSLSKQDDKHLVVEVKDNGKGMPDGLDWEKSKAYGMKLIQTLSKKLKAQVQFVNENGLTITMIITDFKLSK